MLRKLFGLFFMFYAIAIPIAMFNANNFRGTKNLIAMAGVIIVEFLFLYWGIALLRKKRVPERKFYGEDYKSDSDRENVNSHTYSSYNSNTVSYSSHNTINNTEINFFDHQNAEEKFEEPKEPVSMNCSGCGAKVKVYPNLSTECEYCGTTMRIS